MNFFQNLNNPSALRGKIRFLMFFASLTCILLPSLALADCNDVGSDEWNTLSEEMAVAYDSGDFNTAIYKGKQLTIICDKHPVVNFTMANIYKKQGNEKESYNYTRKASENIQNYPIPPKLAEKIWMTRAETELPYKRALEEKSVEYNLLKTQSDKLEADLLVSKSNNEQLLKDMETMKWVGTGFAVGGGVLIIMGSVVAGIYHEKAQDVLKRSYGYGTIMTDFNKYNNTVYAGYGMLAGGIAMGITGSIMAIYSHLAIGKIKTPNAELSFEVTPTSASLKILF